MNKYLLYPGCSMDSSAKAYMESLNSIVEPLDLHLEEIEDWNCCGATEYLGINLIPAYSLIARNLALAAKQMNPTNGTGERLLRRVRLVISTLPKRITTCRNARPWARK